MTLVEFPLDATCGLEMRVAHHEEMIGCEAVSFPNQGLLPAFVERHALVRGNEFVAARLTGPDVDGVFSVEVEVRETAARKIDELGRRPKVTGLGVFKRGQPIQLIQAVHGIAGRTLAWYGFLTEEEARAMLDLFGGVAGDAQGA